MTRNEYMNWWKEMLKNMGIYYQCMKNGTITIGNKTRVCLIAYISWKKHNNTRKRSKSRNKNCNNAIMCVSNGTASGPEGIFTILRKSMEQNNFWTPDVCD